MHANATVLKKAGFYTPAKTFWWENDPIDSSVILSLQSLVQELASILSTLNVRAYIWKYKLEHLLVGTLSKQARKKYLCRKLMIMWKT
jgi:hypothetical protein